MRPAPIPDDQIVPGTVRRVVGAPDGDLTGSIRPVEACVGRMVDSGVLVYHVRCIPEGDDLAKLAAGGTVWVTFLEHMVPFDIQVEA